MFGWIKDRIFDRIKKSGQRLKKRENVPLGKEV